MNKVRYTYIARRNIYVYMFTYIYIHKYMLAVWACTDGRNMQAWRRATWEAYGLRGRGHLARHWRACRDLWQAFFTIARDIICRAF